jgi:hypothetical protein
MHLNNTGLLFNHDPEKFTIFPSDARWFFNQFLIYPLEGFLRNLEAKEITNVEKMKQIVNELCLEFTRILSLRDFFGTKTEVKGANSPYQGILDDIQEKVREKQFLIDNKEQEADIYEEDAPKNTFSINNIPTTPKAKLISFVETQNQERTISTNKTQIFKQTP